MQPDILSYTLGQAVLLRHDDKWWDAIVSCVLDRLGHDGTVVRELIIEFLDPNTKARTGSSTWVIDENVDVLRPI